MFEEVIESLDSFAANPDNLEGLAQVKETLTAKGKEWSEMAANADALSAKVSELRDMNQRLYLKTTGIQPVTPEQTAPPKEEAPKLTGFEKISQGLGNAEAKGFEFTPTIKFGDGINR